MAALQFCGRTLPNMDAYLHACALVTVESVIRRKKRGFGVRGLWAFVGEERSCCLALSSGLWTRHLICYCKSRMKVSVVLGWSCGSMYTCTDAVMTRIVGTARTFCLSPRNISRCLRYSGIVIIRMTFGICTETI